MSKTTRVDLDALDAEANRAPYQFDLGGKPWELPNFADLTLDQAERFDDDRRGVLKELLGAEFIAVVSKVKLKTFNALVTGWMRTAGVDEGEGEASASS